MVDREESHVNVQGIVESPGKILAQARARAGLSQDQIAKELYMTVAKVKAIESDDYGRLSSDTFVRGYIRAYANLVKVDVVHVLNTYEEYLQATMPVDEESLHISGKEQTRKSAWFFLLMIAVFFLGLWLISVWFFNNHTEKEYVLPAAAVATSNISEAAAYSAVSTHDSVLAKVAITQSSTGEPALSNPDVSVATSSLAEEDEKARTQTSIAAKKITLDEISFTFNAECWLEVSDSRGDVLATELQTPGSNIKLYGRAPFDVKLGNAPAVDILLNGKKVEVIPLVGSNVLTLKVGN